MTLDNFIKVMAVIDAIAIAVIVYVWNNPFCFGG